MENTTTNKQTSIRGLRIAITRAANQLGAKVTQALIKTNIRTIHMEVAGGSKGAIHVLEDIATKHGYQLV